jgi:hypothetical protein
VFWRAVELFQRSFSRTSLLRQENDADSGIQHIDYRLMRGNAWRWALIALIVAARMATVGSSPCADAVSGMQRSPAFVSAFTSYFMVRGVLPVVRCTTPAPKLSRNAWWQNASVAVASDGYSFTPTESGEYAFQAACRAEKGYYCKLGGSISVTWMSQASKSPQSLSGDVVRVCAICLSLPQLC